MMAAGKESSSHFLWSDRCHICKHLKGLAEFGHQLAKVFNNPFEILGTPRFDLPFLVGGIICMHCTEGRQQQGGKECAGGFHCAISDSEVEAYQSDNRYLHRAAHQHREGRSPSQSSSVFETTTRLWCNDYPRNQTPCLLETSTAATFPDQTSAPPSGWHCEPAPLRNTSSPPEEAAKETPPVHGEQSGAK